MISTLRIRAWHVAAVLAVVTAVVAITLASASQQAASKPVSAGVPLSAPANEPIAAYDGYIGWGQVEGMGLHAGASFRAPDPVAAWQWYPRYGWYQRGRAPASRVYIYPYASGWSWTWTEATGWYAMRTSDLLIGYRPVAIAT